MKSLFKNKELGNLFDKKGFVKFQLFDKKDVMEILNFYQKIKKEHNVTNSFFHTTMNTCNSSLIKKVHEFLTPYFERCLNKHLEGFNLTISGLLIKESGEETAVSLHQDWTYVDESRYSAANLWVSLEDTTKRSGCMQFVPTSHLFTKTLRVSPDIPGVFTEFRTKLNEYLVDVPTKAGECVMFNQSILHASRKNASGKERPACVVCAYPKEAILLHHFVPNKGDLSCIDQYEISQESMLLMKKDEAPKHAKLLQTVSYKPPKVTLSEFRKFLNQEVSWSQRLKSSITNLFIGKSQKC